MSKVRLGDVAIEHKETLKGNKDGYPIVGLEHLIPEDIRLTQWSENTDNTFTKVFRKGCVLFGRRRAYLKKAAYAHMDGICSGDITVIEAIPGKILPELLPFIIQNDDLFDFAVGKSAGSLSPRVKWEHLKNYEFELPDLEKQAELARILWSMVETKESYQTLIRATDDLVKSQFIELMKNKEASKKIADFCELGILNAAKIFDKESEIYYIEISSIDGDTKKINLPTPIQYKNAPSSAKYVLKQGDVLVSLVRPNLKKIAINSVLGTNVVGTSGFCVLRAKDKMSSELIKAIVTSDEFTSKMIDSATGSTYPTIKDTDVLNYPICDFNESEISAITTLIKQSDKSKFYEGGVAA